MGKNFKSETNVQYSSFRWNYGRASDANASDVTILDKTDQAIAYIGHPGYLFDSHEETVQAQQKLTFYLGKHTLKTGLELISANHFLFGGGNPNGSYRVKLTDAQVAGIKVKGINLAPSDIPSDAQVLSYNVELRPSSFGKTQNIISAYAEDAISINNKLNVTLGLRYDYDDLSKGGSTKGDADNIAPRLSFNYKLTDNSSLRGGFGIIYDKILYAIYSDALQQNTTSTYYNKQLQAFISTDYKKQLQAFIDKGILPKETDISAITFDGNQSASATNVTYGKGPSATSLQEQRAKAFSGERRILNPNGYKNPYTNQFSLGYQKQLNEKQLFYVDFV